MEEERNPNGCIECEYKGSEEDICPDCGGSMVSAEELGEEKKEGD